MTPDSLTMSYPLLPATVIVGIESLLLERRADNALPGTRVTAHATEGQALMDKPGRVAAARA